MFAQSKIAIDAGGRWAYVAHTLGRPNVPATQLDRGWVNTNALSILDLRARSRYATVLLDTPQRGAADLRNSLLSPGISRADPFLDCLGGARAGIAR